MVYLMRYTVFLLCDVDTQVLAIWGHQYHGLHSTPRVQNVGGKFLKKLME